jgi:hypothetical protein
MATAQQIIDEYNTQIEADQQTIEGYQMAIQASQNSIDSSQQTVDADQLALANDNTDPADVPGLELEIQEAQANIAEKQADIANYQTQLTAAQNDLASAQNGLATATAQTTGASTPGAVPNQDAKPSAYDANGNLNPGYVLDLQGNPVYVGNNYIQGPPINGNSTTTNLNAAGLTPAQRAAIANGLTTQVINGVAQLAGVPTNVVNAFTSGNPATLTQLANQTINQAASQYLTPDQAAAIQQQATLSLAQQQQTIADQQRAANYGDWRVKLSLAPGADYLYNASNPGILAPLSSQGGTGGVIFPYMPAIDTSYHASYSSYDLTHSNYRGYFYQNSYTDNVRLRAQFTAQNTNEANYLLAVIHFFRSVTKMFYGANENTARGSPPPLVYLTGLGSYQFSQHPCVVTNFDYNLPADVDYIRALSNTNLGTNQQSQQTLQSTVPTNGSTSNYRLSSVNLPPGAMPTANPAPTTADLLSSPTYVPTKMEISITLLPIQSRQQVSQNFSLRDYASGTLLNGGFW